MSIVLLVMEGDTAAGGEEVARLPAWPTFLVPLASCSDLSHVRYPILELVSHEDGSCRIDLKPVETPWILLLETGEFLRREAISTVADLVIRGPRAVRQAAVARRLCRETLEGFQWVTSRNMGGHLSGEEGGYFTLEPRLVPHEDVPRVRLLMDKGVNHPCPLDKGVAAVELSRLVVSRSVQRAMLSDRRPPPPDPRLFLDGHAAHFDDTIFSPRFVWPGASFRTMRQDHVAAIEEGVGQGLATPDMVAHAISYLIRFGLYEKARSLGKKVPPDWVRRHAALAQMLALTAFVNGQKEQVLDILQGSEASLPSDLGLQLNLAKIQLLLGRDQEAMDTILANAEKGIWSDAEMAAMDRLARAIRANSGARASLSLCIIARDEAEHLPQCLGSVRGLADEVIVVDTGSRDTTVEIARDFGATVLEFPWGNDFSAARNFAIGKASCDYIFMLDADEYVVPQHLLNLHVMKTLLPVKDPSAFRFTVAHIQTRHNWLVFVRAVNPKVEGQAVRIFPRLQGILYEGEVEEEIEGSIRAKGIPLADVSMGDAVIFHEPTSRARRIRRKLPLYDEVKSPTPRVLLAAIRDCSAVGDTHRLLHWLHRLHLHYGKEPWAWPYNLKLARYMETGDPQGAEEIYREILAEDPSHSEALCALAGLLVRMGRVEELPSLMGLEGRGSAENEGALDLDHRVFRGLAALCRGHAWEAAMVLDRVLLENPVSLLGQAARFYFLTKIGELAGAASALEEIRGILGQAQSSASQGLARFVDLVEGVSEALGMCGAHWERGLILAGARELEGRLRCEAYGL